jgi:SAM-dependent methyltransferase
MNATAASGEGPNDSEEETGIAATQKSWNLATRRHNAHKKDQAAFFCSGGTTLFAEERALLGDLRGKRLLHLQCNSGQDSLSLVGLGADVTGVDISDEAIRFAHELAHDTGHPAAFIQSEAVAYVTNVAAPETFDTVFFSYGALGWIRDLTLYFAGMARVLKPGGTLVGIEFHPLLWCFDEHQKLTDSYQNSTLYRDPVSDYINAELAPSGFIELEDPFHNPHRAESFQHTIGQTVTAVLKAGLRLTQLQEYPYTNGFRPWPTLTPLGGQRFGFAEGAHNLPLMFSITATK